LRKFPPKPGNISPEARYRFPPGPLVSPEARHRFPQGPILYPPEPGSPSRGSPGEAFAQKSFPRSPVSKCNEVSVQPSTGGVDIPQHGGELPPSRVKNPAQRDPDDRRASKIETLSAVIERKTPTRAFYAIFNLHLNFTFGPPARGPSPLRAGQVGMPALLDWPHTQGFPRSPVSFPPKPGIA
jgi:hypothetical protein